MRFVLLANDTEISLRVARVVGKGSKTILGHKFEMLRCRFLNHENGQERETRPFLAPASSIRAIYEDEYPCNSDWHNYRAALIHLLDIHAASHQPQEGRKP